MRPPHELTPLTIYGSADQVPTPAHGHRVTEGPAALTSADLLAEPGKRSGEWGAGCVRRLVAMSCGPVAVGPLPHAHRARLEAAGVFVGVEGTDSEEARSASWQRLPALRRLNMGYGSPAPRLVLVGEQTNRANQWPFASKGGTWLLLALRHLGWDELTVYLANAKDHRGRRRTRRLEELHEVLGDVHWVALGREAVDCLKAAKIPHGYACHPSHHLRFKHGEDVAGYAKHLRAGGVALWNPAADRGLATAPVEALPELPPPYDIRSLVQASARGAKTTRRTGTKTRTLAPAKRSKARTAYVSGDAPTLVEAARMAGAHIDRIRECAREEDWQGEREEHHRQLTSRKLEAALQAETRAIENSRKLAWAATERSLGSIVKRLSTGDLEPTPRDAEALSRIALSLSGSGLAITDPEQEQLAQIPLAELARRALEQIEVGLGGGA